MFSSARQSEAPQRLVSTIGQFCSPADTLLPHIALLPHMAEDPHIADDPHIALLPHIADDPHMALLPHNAEDPHIADVEDMNWDDPHIAELPHLAEVFHTADGSNCIETFPVPGSYVEMGDIAVPLATSVDAIAASKSR